MTAARDVDAMLELAGGLTAATASGDADVMRAVYEPDAIVCHNCDGTE